MKRTLYMAAGVIATAIGFSQRPLSAADSAPITPLPPLDLDSQQAEARVTLHGQVVDEHDRGVATALVIAVRHPEPSVSPSHSETETPSYLPLGGGGSEKRVQVVADESGRFLFSDLPPGRYVLVAIHGHHSPGHSDPVVVGLLGMAVPIRLEVGPPAPRA